MHNVQEPYLTDRPPEQGRELHPHARCLPLLLQLRAPPLAQQQPRTYHRPLGQPHPPS